MIGLMGSHSDDGLPANLPEVVSQDEWSSARKRLLAEEKELTHARDAVNVQRRRLPMVRVDKEYVFDTPSGKAGLLDLFEGRWQLIVDHTMWLDDEHRACPSCSARLDQIGHLAHLHARSTTFAVVSRGPLDEIEAFRSRMGWTFPWYSRSAATSTTTSTSASTSPSHPSSTTTSPRQSWRSGGHRSATGPNPSICTG